MPLLTLSVQFAASISHHKGAELPAKPPFVTAELVFSLDQLECDHQSGGLARYPLWQLQTPPLPRVFFPQNYLFWLWSSFMTPSSLVWRKSHSKLIAHCCLRKKRCRSLPKEMLTFLLSRTAFVSSPLCATAIFPCRVSTTKGWQFCSSEIPEVEYLVCPMPRFETYSFFRLSALKTWFIRPIPFGRKREKKVLFGFLLLANSSFLLVFIFGTALM